MTAQIDSTTIEFHRFGNESATLEKDKAYIRTSGWQKAAEQIAVRVIPREIRRSLNRLRYQPGRKPQAESAAKQLLAGEAAYFLGPALQPLACNGALHQLDIVTHASELRAFPFEALYADTELAALDSPDSGTVITRRIRGEFSDNVPPWPEEPTVLFVHAERDHDLGQALVDQHRAALVQALEPWADASQLETQGLLTIREVTSVRELREARLARKFSHIHVLAHGIRIPEDGLEDHECEWGLRLGREGGEAASPREVSEALRPVDEHPFVVTLACCDGSNAERPELGNASLAEGLHRSGIPVVIASQLPLTQQGSVTLTRAFYRPLLSGADVRKCLHEARVALRQEARACDERLHDWLSLVGYVRLPPEGYSQYLRAFGLRVQLRLLEAARRDAEPLYGGRTPGHERFAAVEGRLIERMQQLENMLGNLAEESHRPLNGECVGLLASASKSLAELRFLRARLFPDDRDSAKALSHTALEDARQWYTRCYRRDMSQHWQGMQMLAIEVALTGRFTDPVDLIIVRRMAEAACRHEQENYWACGTLAEAVLLGAAQGQEVDLSAAKDALAQLLIRSARDPKDQGYAALSTRRQLGRYVSWWTKANGFFPGLPTDLSDAAAELVQFLDVGSPWRTAACAMPSR